MTLDGAFNQSGVGAVQTAGNIDTTNDDIFFNGPVSLNGSIDLDTISSGSILLQRDGCYKRI